MQKEIFYVENSHCPQSELHVHIADTFFTRLRGLMLRKAEDFALGQGLLIAPCNSIHMMFMRFPIDVVYIDKDYRVLKTVENLAPWYGLSWCLKSNSWGTVELPVNTIKTFGIKEGSRFVKGKI